MPGTNLHYMSLPYIVGSIYSNPFISIYGMSLSLFHGIKNSIMYMIDGEDYMKRDKPIVGCQNTPDNCRNPA